MDLHQRDLNAARAHAAREHADFPALNEAQLRAIRRRVHASRAWYRRHPRVHNAIGLGVLGGLLVADFAVLALAPAALPWSVAAPGGAIAAGVLLGAVHAWIVCSIVTYSLHEGAVHDLIVQGRGRVARAARVLANNACRLFVADPEYYRAAHADHHRHLGSERDGSFTSFVRPSRLALALLPMAPVLSLSDFFPWRPQARTASRRLSAWLGKAYIAAYVVGLGLTIGWIYAVVAVVLVGAWLSFVLDRLRESTEHALMPLDGRNGTRCLGLGFWGLLLGGGPWGQPCHLAHHLAPALPWYQQLALHRHLRRTMTPAQRRAFTLPPVWGVPALWLRMAREARREQDAGARAARRLAA